MNGDVVVLDSDTLSELSRGHPTVTVRAREYLKRYGRFTVTSITIFERLRGYRSALRAGKPYEAQLRQFEAFIGSCIALPLDTGAADVAATIWAALSPKKQKAIGDILIAAITASNGLALVTRNRRDFAPIAAVEGVNLPLVDWSR
ncbi:MAG: PIN domain-containing protein [Myxococcota bacterium]